MRSGPTKAEFTGREQLPEGMYCEIEKKKKHCKTDVKEMERVDRSVTSILRYKIKSANLVVYFRGIRAVTA